MRGSSSNSTCFIFDAHPGEREFFQLSNTWWGRERRVSAAISR